MHTQRRSVIRTGLSALLAATLLGLPACGGAQPTAPAATTTAASSADSEAEYQRALAGGDDLVTTFIGERFTDDVVKDEASAEAAVGKALDRIGADETTILELQSIRPVEDGPTYYVYRQLAGDVAVHGASLKLIVGADGHVAGLTSAILPKLHLPDMDENGCSAADAEKAVTEAAAADQRSLKVVEGATEQTLLPYNQDNTDKYVYSWVVYTNNDDAKSDMAYLAHYVDMDGKYNYNIPISEPSNADALTGVNAAFSFDQYQATNATFTVELHDGTPKELNVPVLEDPSTGETILADAKRKVLCADYGEYQFQKKTTPLVSADATFNEYDLLAYDTFLRVWDFFDGIGWTGADGEGTPTLLLMNFTDKDGKPQDQAFYRGKEDGYQVFTFNRVNPDGENTDIITHEFTHCITSTLMLSNLYLNDQGAINEGLSDVIGNAVEMLVENKPENAWRMGSGSGQERTLRNMADPHEHEQPAHVWDTYWAPNASSPTGTNDYGGVHTNSSLLNLVSYRLDQAGMKPNEQLYLWLNVSMAMTPRTDYPQLAQIILWSLAQTGLEQYRTAAQDAIAEVGMGDTHEAAPTSAPADAVLVTCTPAQAERFANGTAIFLFVPADGKGGVVESWPAAGTNQMSCVLPAGAWRARVQVQDENGYLYRNGAWEPYDAEATYPEDEVVLNLEAGKTVELSDKGLEALDAPALADAA